MFLSPGRTRILSATRNLVRRDGYAAVSLRRIAAEAGYSPAGLYAHYPSLGGILDALADLVRQELAAALEKGAEKERDAVEQLVGVGMAYIRYGLDHPAEFELLFRLTRSRKKSRSDPTPSSFDLLRRLARAAAPGASTEEIDSACLGLWSSAHGLANLRAAHLAGVDCDWEVWSRRILHNQVGELPCTASSS
jgi:AcrR family transcriptional regulator